jgi:hypothetical protein
MTKWLEFSDWGSGGVTENNGGLNPHPYSFEPQRLSRNRLDRRPRLALASPHGEQKDGCCQMITGVAFLIDQAYVDHLEAR